MESPALQSSSSVGGVEGRSFLFALLNGATREGVFWALNAGFWAGMGFIGWLITRAFQSAMPDVGLALLLRVSTGFVLTAILRGGSRQPWFRRRGRWTKLVLTGIFCLGCGLLEVVVLQGAILGGIAVPGGTETGGLRLLAVRMFVLSFWSALYFAFHLFEDQHALEMRATRAELATRELELRYV